MQMKNNKLKILILILISTLLIQFSYSDDNLNSELNSYQYIKLNITNQIIFQTQLDKNYDINYFKIKSRFMPVTYSKSQYLNEFTTNHKDYKIYNNSGYYIIFNYNNSNLKNYNQINNNFIIESTLDKPKIKNKELYPQKYSKKYDEYLEFIDLIDTNNLIQAKASQLAANEDDTYIISVKIADWIINYIDYDLSTITENPNQKSTQVFDSRKGVCKEITNLYVSMMRSLGIPARVVVGYTYTTSPEVINYIGSNWGGHAWAEVLIDDKWVPFDLTYNQYGYVDATHIVLDKSKTINENGVSINASGYGFNLVQNSLKIENNFKVIDKQEKLINFDFSINIDGPKELAPQSYGYLKIDIENTQNYYQVLYLKIAKTTEINSISKEDMLLIFKPYEKKEIYYKYQIPSLEKNYIYTFPFTIYNNNFEQKYNITVKEKSQFINYNQLPEEKIEDKILSNNNLDLICELIYSNSQNTINCYIKNTNNFEIENFKLCAQNECKLTNLLLNEEKQIQFKTINDKENITYTLNNKSNTITIKAINPKITYSHNLKNEKLEIGYNIEKIEFNPQIEIYNNQVLLNSSNKKQDTLQIPIEFGINNITIELKKDNEIIAKEKFQIQINQKIEEKKFINKIIEKITKFIKNLFS